MGNTVEYILKLTDNATAAMKKIGAQSNALKDTINATGAAASGLGNVLKAVGIGFSMFQIVGMMKEGAEKAKALHQAEAQLANTMKNMGTYSREAYEKATKSAADMSKSVLYSRSEIIELQSQLRMVGNIGENEMQRLTMASADMATKFGTGITEAGSAIAKAVNNPEMMRRLAMQLKIDPNTVDTIQKIAKAGNEARARLMLMDIVEQKVGGAALAAFNADPLAQYNKAVGSIKMQLGEVAIKMQTTLAPLMLALAELVKKAVVFFSDTFGKFFNLLREGNPILSAVVVAVGALAAAIGIASLAVQIWTGVQWLLNLSLWSNPIGLVILAIIALIAIIAYVVYATEGWGKTWDNMMNWMKLGIELFKEKISLVWMEIKDTFISGFEVIEEGWYKLKKLWSKDSANAALSKLAQERNERAREMSAAKDKVDGLQKQMSDMTVWEVKGNGKSLGSLMGELKNKVGLGSNSQLQQYSGGGIGGGGSGGSGGGSGSKSNESISTGGARSSTINITIKSMIENLVFQGGTKENQQEVERNMAEAMYRVLGMASTATN
jgi:uncharacterized membrane protein YgcG